MLSPTSSGPALTVPSESRESLVPGSGDNLCPCLIVRQRPLLKPAPSTTSSPPTLPYHPPTRAIRQKCEAIRLVTATAVTRREMPPLHTTRLSVDRRTGGATCCLKSRWSQSQLGHADEVYGAGSGTCLPPQNRPVPSAVRPRLGQISPGKSPVPQHRRPHRGLLPSQAGGAEHPKIDGRGR
jgi:hypothetical protein